MDVCNDLKPHQLTAPHHHLKVYTCFKLSLHELPGLCPVKETSDYKKRKNMWSWAAPVNCPHLSGTEQAVQTSTATSVDREEPQRSAIYRKTPRSQETGDGRCEPGERGVTNMWLKQRKQRERERETNRYVLMYLSTHRWFVSQKHLQKRTHTLRHTHVCAAILVRMLTIHCGCPNLNYK